jgi:hypothetical protein
MRNDEAPRQTNFAFDEKSVKQLFASSLKDAEERLLSLKICCCEKPSFHGLSGWVFEQTIQHCLCKELEARGIKAEIKEQVSLGGSSKADLRVGTVLMEIKARGLFDSEAAMRYGRYSAAARERGYSYLFITAQETYKPYRAAVKEAVGRTNAFFLDEPGDWARFVQRLLKCNRWK